MRPSPFDCHASFSVLVEDDDRHIHARNMGFHTFETGCAYGFLPEMLHKCTEAENFKNEFKRKNHVTRASQSEVTRIMRRTQKVSFGAREWYIIPRQQSNKYGKLEYWPSCERHTT